jgi:hypothetical protein
MILYSFKSMKSLLSNAFLSFFQLSFINYLWPLMRDQVEIWPIMTTDWPYMGCGHMFNTSFDHTLQDLSNKPNIILIASLYRKI